MCIYYSLNVYYYKVVRYLKSRAEHNHVMINMKGVVGNIWLETGIRRC